MLPPGSTVSSKAAQQLRKERSARPPAGAPAVPSQPAEPEPSEGEPPQVGSEPEPSEVGPPQVESEPERPESEREATPDDVLRPLGGDAPPSGPPGTSARPAVPTHGLSDNATKTSIDISQYVGDDQSIFRPMERPETGSTLPGGVDPLARRRRAGTEKVEFVSEIPDNTRLGRSVVSGIVICIILGAVQTVVNGGIPPKELHFAALHIMVSRRDSIVTAIMYGGLAGLLLGLGLGAILVRLKKGPFLGLVIGFLVGWGLQNPPWGLIAGALTGILAGRFATVGLRRTVTV